MRELIEVAEKLDEWIGGHFGLGENPPLASVDYCPNGAYAISVGDVCVYCSEAGIGQPTFEWCRNEFLRHIAATEPFWRESLGVPPEQDDPARLHPDDLEAAGITGPNGVGVANGANACL